MKYISEKEIVKSWTNLIDFGRSHKAPLNKFFGLIEIMRLINPEKQNIIANKQYTLSNSALSRRLQEIYYFNDVVKDFSSEELLYVILPNHWQSNVLQVLLKNHPISLKDVAIVCMHNKAFENDVDSNKLISLFLSEYNISVDELILFDQAIENIEFKDDAPNRTSTFNAIKIQINVTDDNKFTLSFEGKLIEANPGEITRGPFIQPLYSGQENLKCILLANFDLSQQYEISTKIIMPQAVSSNQPLNQILYGPPGTGKTYNTINHALSIIKGYDIKELKEKEKNDPQFRAAIKKEFDELIDGNQIQFVTFHQSYSYEEFVEGIKPKINDNGDIEYSIEDGIFKKMCLLSQQKEEYDFEDIYDEFTDDVKSKESISLQTTKQKKDFQVKLSENGELCAITNNGKKIPITRKAVKEYMDKGIKPLWHDSSYVRGIGDYLKDKYSTKFSNIHNEEKKFVLIIDEINRGNISKIFGELITLIEDTRRIGEPEALKVRLTYSGAESEELFGVPKNLYILGTMNTADRSIALLDTALRRRFTFFEYTSEPNLLATDMQGVNIKSLLETINKRIEFLLDKDHLIGHAFFINVDSIAKLANTFKNKILPLLEEYFYSDCEKMQLILGDNKDWGKLKKYQIIQSRTISEQKEMFGTADIDGFEEKVLFEINSDFLNQDPNTISADYFKSIYTKDFKEN